MIRQSEGPDSAKVKETKQRIKAAFFALYKADNIKKITVSDIAEQAGVNRATFYAYYLDIYDLREQIETETLSLMEVNMQRIMDTVFVGELDEAILPQMDFFRQNRDYIALAFGDNANPVFVDKMKARVKSYILRKLDLDAANLPPEAVYAMEYFVSGQFGIVSYWFRHDIELSPTELKDMLLGINFKGSLQYMFQLANKTQIYSDR